MFFIFVHNQPHQLKIQEFATPTITGDDDVIVEGNFGGKKNCDSHLQKSRHLV
jgi:hypothetical protein